MQPGIARHRKWTRGCSQSCTQQTGAAEAGAARQAQTNSSNSLGAHAVHAGARHAATQSQQYAKRSRYCLQLTTANAGATLSLPPASTAGVSRHKVISSQQTATQAPAAPALTAPTKGPMPARAAVVKGTHRVYVRTDGQQVAGQQEQPLGAALHASRKPQPPQQRQLPVTLRQGSSAGTAAVPTTKNLYKPTAGSTTAEQSLTTAHVQQQGQQQQQQGCNKQQALHTSSVQQQQGPQWGRNQQATQDDSRTASRPQQGQLKLPAAVAAAAGHNQQQQPAAAGSPSKQREQPGPGPQQPQVLQQQPQNSRAPQQSPVKQPLQQRQQLQRHPKRHNVRGSAAGPGQLITRPAANGTVKLVYKKNRNKLERTGVQAAVAGASLTWVNASSAPHLAAAAQAAVAATAAAVAAKRAQQKERLQQIQQRRQQRLQKQQQMRQQLLQKKRQASATAAAAAAGTSKAAVKQGAPGFFKLVRIGGQLYYSTSQGLCSAAAARLLARKSLGYSTGLGHHGAGTARAAAAAAKGLGVRKVIAKPSSSSSLLAARQRPAAAAAGVAKRLLSSSAVARSLAVARGRHAAKKAAARRGLCLHFCKHGKCGLALRGDCEKVHDPSKVAVCQQWLAGKCSNSDCKLQHKVVPELMPVCTYFLEGVCSNRDCPYLHVKVAADAPACRAFLQGYCPAGASCAQKHLTYRMLKQQHKQQQKKMMLKAGQRHTDRAAAASAGPGVTGKVQEKGTVAAVRAAGHREVDGVSAVEGSGSTSLAWALEHLLPEAEADVE